MCFYFVGDRCIQLCGFVCVFVHYVESVVVCGSGGRVGGSGGGVATLFCLNCMVVVVVVVVRWWCCRWHVLMCVCRVSFVVCVVFVVFVVKYDSIQHGQWLSILEFEILTSGGSIII